MHGINCDLDLSDWEFWRRRDRRPYTLVCRASVTCELCLIAKQDGGNYRRTYGMMTGYLREGRIAYVFLLQGIDYIPRTHVSNVDGRHSS